MRRNSRTRFGELVDHWGDMLGSLPQADRVRQANLRYLTEADVPYRSSDSKIMTAVAYIVNSGLLTR
jgi:hypothetical protein